MLIQTNTQISQLIEAPTLGSNSKGDAKKSITQRAAKVDPPGNPSPFDYRHGVILAADIVGYSRLMESWEIETYKQIKILRQQIIDPGIANKNGEIIKNTGDGFLAIFDDVHQATDCVLHLQKAITSRTSKQPGEQRIIFRMALNMARFIIDDEDIHGDGVNIAARLQAYAPPGGIIVSGLVAERIGDAFDVNVIDLGELHLRNIGEPVRVFELRMPMAPAKLIGDAAPGADQRAAIAVLPFRMNLTSPDEAYFADGIVDDIIHGLASLKELFVVSRGSALGYGGSSPDVATIGRELGVRYILYGSVQRSDGRLRLYTELSDAETGMLVETRKYEGGLHDLFDLQDRIAVGVVKAIAPHVQERELLRAMRKHPQDMNAYDLVLQAQNRLYRMDYDSFCQARGLLQQAISYDPRHGPAYYYSALWYVFRVGEIGSSEPGDAEAGTAMAKAAIDCRPNDAMALSISGQVQSFLQRDYKGAMATLDRAIELGPSLAMAWTMSSATCSYVGEGKLAIERAERGVHLSPLDARTFWHEGFLAQAYYIDGRYEEALDWAKNAVARNESIRFNLRTLIATLAALGQRKEATQAARQLLQVQPDFRLHTYVKRCPFQGDALESWIRRLRWAGIPE